MTIDVDLGRKATNKQTYESVHMNIEGNHYSSVGRCWICEQEIAGLNPTVSAVLCPLARQFILIV